MDRAWFPMRGRRGTGAAVAIIAATILALGAGPAAGVAAAPRPAAAPFWGSFVIDGDPATGLSGGLTMPGGFPEFGLIESTSNGLAAAGAVPPSSRTQPHRWVRSSAHGGTAAAGGGSAVVRRSPAR